MHEESRADQIERAIREVAELDVVVEESDGVITLEGIVDSERDREAAEDIAADLAGDAEIDNALEVQDTLPVSVDSFNDERRSADAEESATADERADAQIEPDFTSQALTDDPQAVSGPTNSADEDDSVDDGDVAYVPSIDPVATPGQQGQELARRRVQRQRPGRGAGRSAGRRSRLRRRSACRRGPSRASRGRRDHRSASPRCRP